MSQVAAVSVAPPVFFMNQGAPVAHKLQQRNFAKHGGPSLGSLHDRAQCLGIEIWWATLNAFAISGLEVDLSGCAV
jgi:predicted peroxiredoxin